MGTSASTSVIDEDNIAVNSLGTGSGNATRVNGGSGDNPNPSYTSWVASNAIQTYDAAVRGGTLRHDVTDYSSASYLPQGPNYSTGRNGDQYFQVKLLDLTYLNSTLHSLEMLQVAGLQCPTTQHGLIHSLEQMVGQTCSKHIEVLESQHQRNLVVPLVV